MLHPDLRGRAPRIWLAALLGGAGLLLACRPSLPAMPCSGDEDCPVCASCNMEQHFCYDSQLCAGGSCQANQCCTGCWQEGACMPGDQVSACGQAGQACQVCEADQPCDMGACGAPPATGLAASDKATCRIRADGSLWCHGGAQLGALGAGIGSGSSMLPWRVIEKLSETPLQGVVEVRGFSQNICARTQESRLYCWGRGDRGQLGNGSRGASTFASQVLDERGQDLDDVAAFDVGAEHICALRSGGEVWCWGDNSDGQLGLGVHIANDIQLSPAPMLDASGTRIHDALAVACGATHSCLLTGEGRVMCAGANVDGQLGDGGDQGRLSPDLVRGLDGAPLDRVLEIAAGDHHSCARRDDGSLWCWGRGAYGALGTGNRNDSHSAVPVSGLDDVVALALGVRSSCALRSSGQVLCWGRNNYGQLGGGDDSDQDLPRPLFFEAVDAPAFERIAAGGDHACAVDDRGDLWCWGRNTSAQLGVDLALVPERGVAPLRTQRLPPLSCVPHPAVSLSVGEMHACAVDSQGQAWCWGDNSAGQLGAGLEDYKSSFARPVVEHPGGAPGPVLASVASGSESQHGCALDPQGQAWCWGSGWAGQLGTEGAGSSPPDTSAPNPVLAADGARFAPFRQIATGDAFSCGLSADADAAVWCWGGGGALQLGNGPDDSSYGSPVEVMRDATTSLRHVEQIAAGEDFACARSRDAHVLCWGYGDAGELGDDRQESQPYPVLVVVDDGQVLSGIVDVAAGWLHACAVDNQGAIWCWGDNENGQLGQAPGSLSPVAVQMGGSLFVARSLSLGSRHSCALDDAGQAWCWGDNSHGQLGEGSLLSRSTPAPLVDDVGIVVNAVVQIEAGGLSTCVRRQGGAILCAGDNSEGQIAQTADVPFASSLTPVNVGCW